MIRGACDTVELVILVHFQIGAYTSNRDVSEWGQVFPEPVLASAAIDRIFDRADIVVFRGESYRLKGRIMESGVDGENN